MRGTKIYIIRHAEAEGNTFRRAHGHFDGLLIGRAAKQIELLRGRFLNESIDAVYSSDLIRSCGTAAAVSEVRGLPIITDERLREVNVGEWEDLSWGDIIYNFPKMCGLFGSDPARWFVNGSEKYEIVRERMMGCLSDIGKKHYGGAVAVFSHGFSIRALTCEILGIPSHETRLIPYCDNTAVALLLYEDDRFTIEYQGDNSHLNSESSTLAKQTWWRSKGEQKSEDLRYVNASGKITALLENESVGLLEIDIARDGDEGAGWISKIFIKPDFRRIGFGVQLLGQAISEFRKLRREKLRLEAEIDSPLMEFCVKFGFEGKGDSGGVCLMERNIRNWQHI